MILNLGGVSPFVEFVDDGIQRDARVTDLEDAFDRREPVLELCRLLRP